MSRPRSSCCAVTYVWVAIEIQVYHHEPKSLELGKGNVLWFRIRIGTIFYFYFLRRLQVRSRQGTDETMIRATQVSGSEETSRANTSGVVQDPKSTGHAPQDTPLLPCHAHHLPQLTCSQRSAFNLMSVVRNCTTSFINHDIL